jgi:hypothetical protein
MKNSYVKTFEDMVMSPEYSTQANTPGIGPIEIPTDLGGRGTPVFPLSSYITKRRKKKKRTGKKLKRKVQITN